MSGSIADIDAIYSTIGLYENPYINSEYLKETDHLYNVFTVERSILVITYKDDSQDVSRGPTFQ
jgi:hypothetical protein